MQTKSNIIVFDIETTINAPSPHFGATPHHRDNDIVLLGYLEDFGEIKITEDPLELKDRIGAGTRLVGHNIAFDLSYLMRHFEISPQVEVWDTQKFDYLLCGRGARTPSLEKTAERMEVPFKKDEEIKERFRVGIGSDKICRRLLTEYLEEDVRTTAAVYLHQLNAIPEDSNRSVYIQKLMQGVLVTTQMAFNGLPFQVGGARKEVEEIILEKEHRVSEATERYARYWPTLLGEFNLSSPSQIKLFLWGGEKKYIVDTQVTNEQGEPIRYKTGDRVGEIKTKKETKVYVSDGLCSAKIKREFSLKGWETNTDDTALKRLIELDKIIKDVREFSKDVLKIRNLEKTISTYYKPYIEYSIDGRIHPNYNHCITQTGRLSSSKPNMQNISGKGTAQ